MIPLLPFVEGEDGRKLLIHEALREEDAIYVNVEDTGGDDTYIENVRIHIIVANQDFFAILQTVDPSVYAPFNYCIRKPGAVTNLKELLDIEQTRIIEAVGDAYDAAKTYCRIRFYDIKSMEEYPYAEGEHDHGHNH